MMGDNGSGDMGVSAAPEGARARAANAGVSRTPDADTSSGEVNPVVALLLTVRGG